MQTKTLFVILLLSLSFGGFAQSKKKKKKQERELAEQGPTSLTPAPKNERVYAPPKKTKNLRNGPTFSAEADFRKRMELVVKQKRKAEKEMMKPQYSDPSYFGHKRPPKKRHYKKMKYCKECGIRH